MAKYIAENSYLLRKIADSYVLISVGDKIANFNGYVQLSESAAFLWKELHEPKSLMELIESLQKEYDVEKGEAETDVKEFMDELLQEGMVKIL